MAKEKNKKNCFFTGCNWLFKNVISFIKWLIISVIWMVLETIDMIITICNPNTKYHKWVNKIYYKEVRAGLSSNVSSRASFTFAHGFFHILVFVIAFICAKHFFDLNISVVKNKYLTIYTSSEPSSQKFGGIDMNWSQGWEMDGNRKLDKYFSIRFKNVVDSPKKDVVDSLKKDLDKYYPITFKDVVDSLKKDVVDSFKKDLDKYYPITFKDVVDSITPKFTIIVRSNFDFEPDTTANTNEVKKVSIQIKDKRNVTYYYERPHVEFGEKGFGEQFTIVSNAKVFDDDETPYVNFYVSFDCQAIDLNALQETCDINIFLNDEFKDGFGNMPYDLLAVKPEPDTNCPYHLRYYGAENVAEVLKKGLYISTVNRDFKQKKDQESFFYSVVIGAIISFLFSIVINLFTKWRNMNQKEGKVNPYNNSGTDSLL